MSKRGVFLDVVGLSYRCAAFEGTTDANYVFKYEPDTGVIFSIGSLVIGESIGKSLLTVLDLVPVNTATFDPKLINRARLLYSLSPALGFEIPVTIDTNVGCFEDSFLLPQ
jgi:hypothetical protein